MKQNEISILAEKILKNKRLYYKGSPVITDHEYDDLENKLRMIAPKHPVLNVVGSDELSSEKIEHTTPMLSLQKTYELKALTKWFGDKDVVSTIKIDGNSLSLVYVKGKLVQAKTRGDGRFGENVLAKILWVSGVPKKLNKKLDIEVRGELVCREGKFNELKKEMKELDLDEPSSARNIVAGVLGRKKYLELARYFDFLAFDLVHDTENETYDTELKKMELVRELGFLSCLLYTSPSPRDS